MKITIYTITDCAFSKEEKEYLNQHNLPFEEKNLETNREFLTEMLSISNNFAGTPVTKIDNEGKIDILKGFTKEEFDKVLGLTAPKGISSTPLPADAPAAQVEPPKPAEPIVAAPQLDANTPTPQPVVPEPVTPPSMPEPTVVEPATPGVPSNEPPMPEVPEVNPTVDPSMPAMPPLDVPASPPPQSVEAPPVQVSTPEPVTPVEPPAPPAPPPVTPPTPAASAQSNEALNSILDSLKSNISEVTQSSDAPHVSTPT